MRVQSFRSRGREFEKKKYTHGTNGLRKFGMRQREKQNPEYKVTLRPSGSSKLFRVIHRIYNIYPLHEWQLDTTSIACIRRKAKDAYIELTLRVIAVLTIQSK